MRQLLNKAILISVLCGNNNNAFFFKTALAPYQKKLRRNQKSFSPSSKLKMSIPSPIDTLTSGLVSICRIPRGVSVASPGKLTALVDVTFNELYDVENSRSCRFVRELLTELEINVKVIPAATNSRVFTDPNDKYSLPKNTVIPRLTVTQNGQDIVLSGHEDIVSFLSTVFDVTGSVPENDTFRILKEMGSYIAGTLRIGRGNQVSGSAAISRVARPVQPLILFSYEGNQFCRLVREVLTELDLVYELRSAGKGSTRREEFSQLSGGSTQCPYLINPYTDNAISDSTEIIRYLYQNYAVYTPPNEVLQWFSDTLIPLARPIFVVLAPLQARYQFENKSIYEQQLDKAASQIHATCSEHSIVIYTYGLSPFATECKKVLKNLGIDFHEVSLGLEWIPGLVNEGGALTRAALLCKTGQSSLPHVFVNGKSIGGLFSGTPGLLLSLEDDSFQILLANASSTSSSTLFRANIPSAASAAGETSAV